MPVVQNCIVVYCVIVVCGCGPRINVVPASGTITLDGEPLANVDISTQPIETGASSVNHPGSQGRTDANGHFTLELQTGDKAGAVVGKHAVYITFGNDPTHQEPNAGNPILPQRYWNGTLNFTVPEDGTNELNFQLESN